MQIDTDDMAYTQVAKVGHLGHTIIPKKIRVLLDLNTGDYFQWIVMKDGSIIIKKVKASVPQGRAEECESE